ncbi:MAG: prolipoprotein diacylglyceryl transferase [Bacteroidales bacterium]|nr:prolipoprotein diacylglyceryl transferase [Bacteroidales bacterium]MCM1416895.1 prolipoprotein diacylglyceryl transferase [bacterium]MCM1424911.1 prolipoprotein diacylglyceryl transferase [bacterium]
MQDIMGRMDIAFPNLGIYLKNVPKSFSVFGFPIALYGVIIALGVLAGVLLAAHVAKREGLDPDVIWDFAIYAIIFSIIGGRIYYVIFSWDRYKDNLLDVFNTRKGGMAIYGAVIAAFLTLWIYCRKKKQSFLQMADICVPGLVLGQVIGRWGNFTNREVFGEYTDNLLAMRLPTEMVRASDISETIAAHMTEATNYIQVHPTFLYESLWNLALLCLLLLYRKHKKFEGEQWLLYLGGYGLGRVWIEGIRTDTLFIPHTTLAVSQVLAALLFVVSLLADLLIRHRIRQNATLTVEAEMSRKTDEKADGEL